MNIEKRYPVAYSQLPVRVVLTVRVVSWLSESWFGYQRRTADGEAKLSHDKGNDYVMHMDV